jgi:hypothetical protein
MKLSLSARPKRQSRLHWGALLLVLGCQQVFGEFEETPSPAPTAPTETGGTDGGPSGTGGQSSSGFCEAREQTCDGAILRRCVNGSWEEETCSSPELCDERGGRCRTCVLDQARCLDAKTVQTCDDANDRWVTQPPCGVGLTCDETRGACVACGPDLGVCVNDLTVLCRCNADQSGFEPRACPGGCLDMGAQDRCNGPEGEAGSPAGACDNIF